MILKKILITFFLVTIIFSKNDNYISIKYSLSSYWKIMPNIPHPFDDSDYFYNSIDNSFDTNEVTYPSMSYAYRKNKKLKSIKKLKKYENQNLVGTNPYTYIITNTHHGNNISFPVVVPLSWYVPKAFTHNRNKKYLAKILKKFTSKNRNTNVSEAALKLINQDIIGTNVSLNLKGDISINGEIVFEDKDLVVLNSSQNKTWDIDLEQTQRFDIEGKIGDKLSLNAQQDSEADFNWENDLTIKWEGTKNDILKSAEAGNISLSLPSTQFVSVGSGKSEGLFGVKSIHQLGPLEIQSVISREQVKKSAKTFSGGQTSEFSYINDYNFIKDRYFFIEQHFKEQYYPLQISNGALSHSFDPNRVIYDYKIYKKSTATSNDGVLDVVYGTAFMNPLDSNSTKISGNWKKLIEGVDYELDRILGVLRLNTTPQEAIAMSYNLTSYNQESGSFIDYDECLDITYVDESDCDGDGDEIFNELNEDYIDNNNNNSFDEPYDFNGTDIELIYDECLDINFDGASSDCDGDGDEIFNELNEDYLNNNEIEGFQPQEPKAIDMQLIKLDGSTTPNYETWSLMFKNVYTLGSSITDLSSLELDIIYNNGGLEETHSQVNNFQSFLTIFGLDTRNSNGEEIKDATGLFYLGDGKVDNNTILINPTYGELFLPSHLPFAFDKQARNYSYQGSEFNFWNFTDFNNYWGINSPDLEYYLDSELNDQDNNFMSSSGDTGPAMYYSTDQGEITGEHEFMIKYKHSSGSSTISLGFMIVEGSETVSLNGNTLTRGIDYTIDYFSGSLNLINAEALLPGANISVTYEENELISFDQKLLFGTHLKYAINEKNFISGGLFYYNQTIMDDNVEVGYEPMRNFIWNINGKFEKDFDQITEFTDKLPFVDATAASSINLEGEFAEVYPNPNPLGKAFLDDFEASKRSISLSLTSRNWKIAAPPISYNGILKDLNSRGSMTWYNPYIEEQTRDIWPDIETSSQAGNTYTKTLWLRPFFNPENNSFDSYDFWNGITTSLYSSDYDLSRKKYLEVWVNAENFESDEDILLHIDIGHISEDINNDNLLNTEDIDVYGNGWGDNNLSDEEDTGIDLCPDLYEDGLGGCNCNYKEGECTIDDENQNDVADPNGDNWCYNNQACSDIEYYKQYNGTEGNADLGRYPDTEDLDKDYSLDESNNYFSYTINPKGDDYTDYIPETNWKLYRVLLNDFELRGDSTVTWSDVRHVRLWVDGMSNTYNYEESITNEQNPKVIKIAKLEIVGNEWLELGGASIDEIASINDSDFSEEPYFAVAVLNTHDNPNEYESPNSDVEGEVDELTGIRMKEQSLVLSFEKSDDNINTGGIKNNQAIAIKKSFSTLPNDKKNSFFAYDKLNMYVYGDEDKIAGGDWFLNDTSQVELLFRFGKDNDYYEIRQPIYEKWDIKNHIEININELTKYKLEISLDTYEDIGIDGCINNYENGFGSCLDTLSFQYYCSENNFNFDMINETSCNEYLGLTDQLQNIFDPNNDNYNWEDVDVDFSNQRTENNYQYDQGEPFIDENGDNIFNPPPTELLADGVWRWKDEILNACNNCNELRIKGAPSINNIQFVFVSILNNTDNTVYGNVWLDELRMTGVKKEKGQAFRLKGSINFSDLLDISTSFEQKDADFHLLQQRLGTGDNKQTLSLAAKLSSDKFFPTKWGLKMPLNFNYMYDIASPKFYPGSDILAGGINEAPDEIKTNNQKTSISGSFAKNSKSDNWLMKYTIDQISLNFSFIDRKKATSTIEEEIARDISFSSKYGYNFSDSNFLLPFQKLSFLPVLGNKLSETRIYWSPEKFSTSISLSEHNQISKQRTGSITPTYSFNLDRKYSMNYRLTKNIKFSYSKDINSNFDDRFKAEEDLNSYILDALNSFSVGLVKKKNESFSTNFNPDFFKWLNPSLKYTSSYSWALANSQSEDPTFNSANIGANGILTSSLSFSPSELIELFYTPEKSNKNRRGRGGRNQKKEVTKEVTNPTLKLVLKSLHTFSDRFSKINFNYSYKVSNSHSNILTGQEHSPDLMYKFALSDSPHSDNTDYNNNNDIVNSYYHQYINDLKLSTNVSLTKKIQASLDYRNNRTLTNQSSTDVTLNSSNTYFPLGIRGDEGIPIFNWNINWNGLEKLPLLNNIFRSVSLQHSFNGDKTASYKDSEVQTWSYSRNFSPLIGFTAKTSNKNPVNFRTNLIYNLYVNNSGTSTEQKYTTQVNGRIDFNRSDGLRIPIFFFRDFNIKNDINFGFDVSYDKSETLMTSVLISDYDQFNQQDLSTTLSLKPRIGYSFTKYISGDIYFNYILTENKTTGRRKEQDFGFNVRIKIKG